MDIDAFLTTTCQDSAHMESSETTRESPFYNLVVPVLAELKFEEAMRNLLCCSLSLFQPVELFPLFPSVIAPWADQVPTKQYWGLHQPLTSLQNLLEREEQAQARTLLEQDAMQSIAEYLLQVPQQPVFRKSIAECLLQVPQQAVFDKSIAEYLIQVLQHSVFEKSIAEYLLQVQQHPVFEKSIAEYLLQVSQQSVFEKLHHYAVCICEGTPLESSQG